MTNRMKIPTILVVVIFLGASLASVWLYTIRKNDDESDRKADKRITYQEAPILAAQVENGTLPPWRNDCQ